MHHEVHGSSSNSPDFVQSSTKRSEASGLVVTSVPFLPTDVIPAWKSGLETEGREWRRRRRIPKQQEPGPGCPALSQAVAVAGGEFEFLCLISHVYSEANNAAFVWGTV